MIENEKEIEVKTTERVMQNAINLITHGIYNQPVNVINQVLQEMQLALIKARKESDKDEFNS